MSKDTKLSEEEKELIQGYKEGKEEAQEDFIRKFKPKIFNIAIGFAKDAEEAKNLTQDIFMKLHSQLKKYEIKENLEAWINKVAKNHCIDFYREKHIKEIPLVGVHEDDQTIAPGSKEYYKENEETSSSAIEATYKRSIPPSLQESLNLSLEHIALFYNLRDQIRFDMDNEFVRIQNLERVLFSTKKKINYILGRISRDEIARYKNLKKTAHEDLTAQEKNELKKLKKKSFKINVHDDINKLHDRLYNWYFHSPFFNDMALVNNTPYDSHNYFGFLLTDIATYFPTMKIQPPRLMFSIWTKAKELRKGKYADLNKIRLIFRYFKWKTKGTDKAFLFDSFDEYLSTFEAVRKSFYKKSPNQKLYNKLVNNIYRISFKKLNPLTIKPKKEELDLGKEKPTIFKSAKSKI